MLYKQHQGCHRKGQIRDLKFTVFYPCAENTLQVFPVPFLPLRRLPPAQSSGQRAETRFCFEHPVPFSWGWSKAHPSGFAVEWPRVPLTGGFARVLGTERAAPRWSGTGRVWGAERHSQHSLFMSRPSAPQGTHFHIIYNYLFALIASSLRRLSWAQEEEKLIN